MKIKSHGKMAEKREKEYLFVESLEEYKLLNRYRRRIAEIGKEMSKLVSFTFEYFSNDFKQKFFNSRKKRKDSSRVILWKLLTKL